MVLTIDQISLVVAQISDIDKSIAYEQLNQLRRIIIEYIKTVNHLEIIYDDEHIPDVIEHEELLTRIIKKAFHTSLQSMPNIVSFIQHLPNFDIQSLTKHTINILKLKFIIFPEYANMITDYISKEQLVMLYAQFLLTNPEFCYKHIICKRPYRNIRITWSIDDL